MNPVLSDILRSKRSLNRDGSGSIDVHSSISVEEGELLSRLIASGSRGFRWSGAGVWDLGAVHLRGDEGIDAGPAAYCDRPGAERAGLLAGCRAANLERAGYGGFVEFIEKPSQIALPALVAAGRRIDFAFIDGEHTFDHVLFDFFFIDQLLNVGGVVVFDDAAWPSIRRVRGLSRPIETTRSSPRRL